MAKHADSDGGESEQLKVLLANEDKDELRKLAGLVERGGHEVVALAIRQSEAAEAIISHEPDVALVLIGDDTTHAIDLILEVRSFAEIPMVALARTISEEGLKHAVDFEVDVLHLPDEAETIGRVVIGAAERHAESRAELRRLGELESVLERRSVIEQAKGILMEKRGIGSMEAFNLIRDHARSNQLRVVEVAQSVIAARELLSRPD